MRSWEGRASRWSPLDLKCLSPLDQTTVSRAWLPLHSYCKRRAHEEGVPFWLEDLEKSWDPAGLLMLGCLLPISFLRVTYLQMTKARLIWRAAWDLSGVEKWRKMGKKYWDKSTGVCSGTFQAHLQPKETTSTQLFALKTRVGHTEMLLSHGRSCNNSCKTGVQGSFKLTRPISL